MAHIIADYFTYMDVARSKEKRVRDMLEGQLGMTGVVSDFDSIQMTYEGYTYIIGKNHDGYVVFIKNDVTG